VAGNGHHNHFLSYFMHKDVGLSGLTQNRSGFDLWKSGVWSSPSSLEQQKHELRDAHLKKGHRFIRYNSYNSYNMCMYIYLVGKFMFHPRIVQNGMPSSASWSIIIIFPLRLQRCNVFFSVHISVTNPSQLLVISVYPYHGSDLHHFLRSFARWTSETSKYGMSHLLPVLDYG
jgi:hypothetical protein